jgi:hypothetical protein
MKASITVPAARAIRLLVEEEAFMSEDYTSGLNQNERQVYDQVR